MSENHINEPAVVCPSLGGQYYIVHSLGTIFCCMLPAEVQCPGKYTCPRGQYWNS